MLFNIDEDQARYIVGWVVPDNPSLEPSLHVVVDGRRRLLIPANHFRNGLKVQGLHKTGICGFLIDETNCPGLGPDAELEIFETQSNLLVFRRSPRALLPIRLFHLETQTSPVYPLEREIAPVVAMSYASAELIGEETLVNIFNLDFTQSVFVSGALSYRRYEPYLRTKAFRRTVILGDPVRELANRLLRLKALGRAGGAGGGWKSLGQAALIAAFAEVDLTDPLALGRAIRALRGEDFVALADPTVRRLVATSPDEPLQDHMVGVALGILADFDVIGFDDDIETFLWNIEALAGGANLSRETTEPAPDLGRVLESLLACKPARDLTRLDDSLISMARDAVERASRLGAAGALGG